MGQDCTWSRASTARVRRHTMKILGHVVTRTSRRLQDMFGIVWDKTVIGHKKLSTQAKVIRYVRFGLITFVISDRECHKCVTNDTYDCHMSINLVN